MDNTNQKPWYKDGLKFSCSGCGDCCTGAPGFVWVNSEEIADLAQHLGMDVESFEDTYTRKIGARRSLREFPNGDCVFFDEQSRHCEVYESRPIQCRTWPFWESNLRTVDDWKRTCEECPGSGTGRLVQLEEIEDRRLQFKL
ncbi:MAG: YkgJ family cysteine cluster protein [Planctomycetota bacterium]